MSQGILWALPAYGFGGLDRLLSSPAAQSVVTFGDDRLDGLWPTKAHVPALCRFDGLLILYILALKSLFACNLARTRVARP